MESVTAVGGKDTMKITVDLKRQRVIIVIERDTSKLSAGQVLSLRPRQVHNVQSLRLRQTRSRIKGSKR